MVRFLDEFEKKTFVFRIMFAWFCHTPPPGLGPNNKSGVSCCFFFRKPLSGILGEKPLPVYSRQALVFHCHSHPGPASKSASAIFVHFFSLPVRLGKDYHSAVYLRRVDIVFCAAAGDIFQRRAANYYQVCHTGSVELSPPL